MAHTFYLDEFQDKSVSFSIGKGYSPFKVYYNEDFIGEFHGIGSAKKGNTFKTADGNSIFVELRTKDKTYLHVEFNGIPIPSSHFYPAKVIKRASIWVIIFGILTLGFGALFLFAFPELQEEMVGYIMPSIGAILVVCFFGIRKYYSIALWTPLILFILNVLFTLTEGFSFGVILQVLAIIALIRAIKPMKQMQDVKKRLKAKDSEHLIDNFLT